MASSSDPSPLVQQVSYHAWNKDLSQIAVSPNTNEVWIYVTNKSQDSTKWERKYVLDEHSGAISGIDWCPETNLIVTCAHDRNAYVWKFDGEAWKPTLVILRINRAATCVKWSPAGNKFAVGSGAKCVPVCHYEKENDWWISKMIKKHKSTILSIAWCVNNKFIITGSSDMKARVFSAYIEGIDPAEDDGFGEVFPAQHEFGEALAEFDAGAWVHAVAWSPGGFRLAFAAHSSAIHFVQLLAGSSPIVTTVKNPHLPYLDVQFLTDNAVVGAGFDFNVDVFEVNGGSETEPQWALKERLDKAGKDKKASTPSSASAGGFQQARGLFSDASKKGVDFGQRAEENTILTKHKNVIVNVQLVPDASGQPTKVTTAGLDGRVLFWDLPKLQ